MLAASASSLEALPFPVIATPKIDGIRCLIVGGRAVTRSLRPIPNRYIRAELERLLPEGADGELRVGHSFNSTTRAVMDRHGRPRFVFHMFDLVGDPDQPYRDRLRGLWAWLRTNRDKRIRPVPRKRLADHAAAVAYEARCIANRFEGICARTPDSPYKQGRSTVDQGWLLKFKRLTDSEAEILDLIPGKNGSAGSVLVRDLVTGSEFSIAAAPIGEAPARSWIGRIVKYSFQPYGTRERPRFPQFVGFRAKEDLS
jgi:DNA ligase-1